MNEPLIVHVRICVPSSGEGWTRFVKEITQDQFDRASALGKEDCRFEFWARELNEPLILTGKKRGMIWSLLEAHDDPSRSKNEGAV